MTLPSMRLPTALTLGATLMPWRGYNVAPEDSTVRAQMMGWLMLCPLAPVAGFSGYCPCLQAGILHSERHPSSFARLISWLASAHRHALPR